MQTGNFNSREVSASSSFLRFILSFRPSASRRAAAIFACICSPDISDIIEDDYPEERVGFLRCEETMTVIGGMRFEGTVGGFERPPPGSRPRRIATTTQVGNAETRITFRLCLCLYKMEAG